MKPPTSSLVIMDESERLKRGQEDRLDRGQQDRSDEDEEE